MARKKVPILDIALPVVDTSAIQRDPDRAPDRLRYEAAAIYVTHPDGVTVEELARDPRFAAVSSRLKEWCAADGWVEGRKKVLDQFGEKLRAVLQKELYNRITQARIDQLSDVATIKARLHEQIINVPAKSAEGAAKAWLEISKHELELVQTVGSEIGAGLGGAFGGVPIEPRNALTETEAVEAARFVLRKRREAVAGGLPAPEVAALLEAPKEAVVEAEEGRASPAEAVDSG